MENKAAWKECFSVRGIRLPTGYYFGITAATGDLSDIHDVLSVRLYELDVPNDVSKINKTEISSAGFTLKICFYFCYLGICRVKIMKIDHRLFPKLHILSHPEVMQGPFLNPHHYV